MNCMAFLTTEKFTLPSLQPAVVDLSPEAGVLELNMSDVTGKNLLESVLVVHFCLY